MKWRAVGWVWAGLILCFSAEAGLAGEKPIWLTVTKPIFLKSLQPLVEHRKAEGFETLVSTQSVEDALRSCPRRPAYLLLIGDDEPNQQNEPWYLPAMNVKQTRWSASQNPAYASDAAYSDGNRDRFPDFPVGRLPVRTAGQLQTVVRKILAYEMRSTRLSDAEVLIWAGQSLYGEMFDRFSAQLLWQMVCRGMPSWASAFVVSSNRGALYCPPLDQKEILRRQLQANPGLICLVGHGNAQQFCVGEWMFSPSKKGVIFCSAEFFLEGRVEKEPLSPMVILTCLSGFFAGEELSFAESLVLSPVGPVACIAASAESHPLPNLYTGQAMLQTLRHTCRLGDAWLRTLHVAKTLRNPMMETVLKFVESSMSQAVDIDAIRTDQATLYELLGDPATTLRIPRTLACDMQANADGSWNWTVTKPSDAETLFVTFKPIAAAVRQPKDWNDTAVVQQAFMQANQRLRFQTLAQLPANESWGGKITQPGVLRFVAIGPKQIYAATKTLTPTSKSPR